MHGCDVVAKGLGTFYYSKMAELKKARSLESDCISDLSPKKSAVPEVEEQVTPCSIWKIISCNDTFQQ